MKNLQITLAIGAISLAAVMSASASITLMGSQLSGLSYTKSPSGTASSGYNSTANTADLSTQVSVGGSSWPSAMVTVVNGTVGTGGTIKLGTLNDLILNGPTSAMFDLKSENIGGNTTGTASGGNPVVNFSAYWQITLVNPVGGAHVTYDALTDGGLGPNYFDSGGSVNYSTTSGLFNGNDTSTWATLAESASQGGGGEGNWTVASVGVGIGDWNQSGDPQNTASIDSFTLYAAAPEPNTMLAAALLILPLGVGALHKLRKNRTENLTT